jgi:hypothetical protein
MLRTITKHAKLIRKCLEEKQMFGIFFDEEAQLSRITLKT